MQGYKVIQLNKYSFSIECLIFISAFKWLLRGIFDNGTLAEIIVLTFGIVSIQKYCLFKKVYYWILYIIVILLNVLFHNLISGWLDDAILYSLIIVYVLFVNINFDNAVICIRRISGWGILIGVSIILQYLFKNNFNNAAWSFYRDDIRNVADRYYLRGYYSGIFYAPHDAACYVALAITAIIFWTFLNKKMKYRALFVFIAMLLMIPLLLTQKKGVIVTCFLAIFLTLLIHFANRKQWRRIIGFVVIAGTLISFMWIYARTHQDSILFYRFNQFLNTLLNDVDSDYGRLNFFRDAISLWSKNKLFGIGWNQFSTISYRTFRYTRQHEVNCDYLQFLCEMGIVGTFLIMIPIVITMWRSLALFKLVKDRNVRIKDQFTILYAICVQIFILLYAFVEIPFNDETYFAIYVFSCIVINRMYALK